MTVELLRLAVGELLLPFAAWLAALGFGSLLIGFVLHRWSRRKLAVEPRTTGRSLALAVIFVVALLGVPFGVTALSVPFVLQRTVASLLENRAPALIAWTAERGQTLWLERAGFQADAPLPPVDELRSRLAEREREATAEAGLARADFSIQRIGALASERITGILADALDTVEASDARTWGEALIAIRPSVEAKLAEEARAFSAGFQRDAWLQLLPSAGVALVGWLAVLGLVVVMPKPASGPEVRPGPPPTRGTPA